MAAMTFTTETARLRMDRIQQLLRRGRLSVLEVADGIFISRKWAQAYLNHMRENKLIYIAEYGERVTSGGYIRIFPLYAWGNKPEPPEVKGIPNAERKRRKHARIAADAEQYDRYIARRRALERKIKPDPLFAWIPRK